MQKKNIFAYLIPAIFLFVSESFSQEVNTDTVIIEQNLDTIIELNQAKDTVFIRDYNYKIINDTSLYVKNPRKAALFSAIIPGLGQAYTRKYWHIPMIYAAMGGLIFAADKNNKEYHRYYTAYSYLTDKDENTVDEFGGMRGADDLLFYKKKFRRSRDLSIIMTVLAYTLNIVDASVTAHFSDFDINDNFSVNLKPVIIKMPNISTTTGIMLSLKLNQVKNGILFE